MSFGAPQWFLGLLLVPLLAGLFIRNEMQRQSLLAKLVSSRLLPDLAASASAPRRRWKFALALLGLACVILALTQPRLGYQIIETHRKGLDVMLAVDTSKSMLSTDVQPDRLTRAKFAAEDLVESIEGNRVGLIAFAGTSFVQAPLTIDYSAVLASLTDLDTDTIPRGGTNIASAIREAAEAFGKGESTHRALILFTDGEELEDDAVQAAKEVNGLFRIFTVGVGTREGSLIPATNADGGTDFIKDANGEYVKSKLDEEKLKEIAAATGGFYIHLDSGPATAKAIVEQGLSRMQAGEYESREEHPIERYEWPLAAGILLLIASASFRERKRRVRPAVKARPAPTPAVATAAVAIFLLATVRGWSVNEGVQLYDQKNYNGAYDVFQNQLDSNPSSDGLEFDSGAASYKKGDYDKALAEFGKVLGSKDPALRGSAEYNLANTLVQRGALQERKDDKIKEWTDALTHYDQALKIDPANADAKYNEELVKRMIEDLNKKEQQQQQNQQNQQDQQNQKDQQNQQQQSQQNQQQQQQQNKQNQQNQQNQQQQNQQQQQANQQNQKNQQQSGGQNQQQANQQNQQNQQQQGQQQQQQQAGGQGQQQQPQQNQQGQQQQANTQDQQSQQQQQASQQNQQNQQQQGQQQQQQAGNQGQQNQPQNGQQNQNEQNPSTGNQTSMNAPSPSPTPGNGQGVLKEDSQNEQQAAARAAARGATEQGRQGEMTPSQAQALVDSMRDEDEHVNLFDRLPKNAEESYKDW